MIVELTGLELLTNAFGVLLMFQGVAAAVGSPLLGKFIYTSNFIMNTLISDQMMYFEINNKVPTIVLSQVRLGLIHTTFILNI